MASQRSMPSVYSDDDAFLEPYAARISAFIEAGLAAGLRPAQDDIRTLALILVDVQHDFVAPMGSLNVPGAQDDVARLLTWLYRSAGDITRIYLSLDTHLPQHIFYSSWWSDPRTGAHPQPYTAITVEDLEQGIWEPVVEPEWSHRYVRALRRQAKKDLMIWPPHTMQGTLGHMLTPALSEAVAWHSAARQAQPVYLSKGRAARTEFYGIFGAEVHDPDEPTTALNTSLLDAVMRYDRVYIAGEAKSHCVVETLRQMTQRFANRPETLRRIHVLRDCTSAVAHPTIDFDALAEAEFTEMQRLGVQFVSSADPIE